MLSNFRNYLLLFSLISFSQFITAQDLAKKKIIQSLQSKSKNYEQIAQKIWSFAELGYKEQKSSIKRKIIIKAIPFALLIVALISSFILLYH